MAKNRYELMSDEELRALSMQKTKKTGCFSRTALAAQRELYNRKHWEVSSPKGISSDLDRDLSDIQYNG